MDKASIQTQLESCREQVVSQNAINASYSNKAMGITTLSLTLFGVGLSGFSGSTLEIVLVIISGVCVLMASLLGLGLIMRVRDWEIPCDLKESEKSAFKSTNTAEFLMELCRSYRKATECNERTLKRKAAWFTSIVASTLVEIVCVIIMLTP